MTFAESTPLGALYTRTFMAARTLSRQVYVEVMTYLQSLSNHIVIDHAKIAEVDARPNGWPICFELCYGGEPIYMTGLMSYKGSPLHIALDRSCNIYLKFPTVTLEGVRLCSYTLRQWRRPNDYPGSYQHTPPGSFELAAFGQGRLPTQEELMNQSAITNSHSKNEYHKVQIILRGTGNADEIINRLEHEHKAYLNSLKRQADYANISRATIYKSYLKYRGKAVFARWQAAQAAQTTTAAAPIIKTTK